ncbi:MAG TPA: alpha/beta fold hydrolase [Nitrospira sp.]
MKNAVVAVVLALLGSSVARAQTETLIEVDSGRTMEAGTGTVPVVQRAILTLPGTPTDTALLYFRGNPGYMLAKSLQDKQRNLGWVGKAQSSLLQAEIALVQMDCPTDQWGESPRPPATKCLNDYRKSKQHADDVRKIMARLKEQHGLSNFYIMGHSIGTVSSRWLAINLGKEEIAGTIHSSTINSTSPKGRLLDIIGNLSNEFPRNAAGAPMLHVHNEMDACRVTPYEFVRDYAKDNLVTVRGGIEEGDPCGGGHLHSHQGREELVMRSIISWIKTKKVDSLIGE